MRPRQRGALRGGTGHRANGGDAEALAARGAIPKEHLEVHELLGENQPEVPEFHILIINK